MLKAGIFLDIENLTRNGGWGIRYEIIKDLAAAQGAVVLRANAYMAIDEEREAREPGSFQKRREYRNAIRRNGYHLTLKPVRRYQNADGETVVKADSDLDLAVDALLQSEKLDYVLLGTGDGDFIRLVRALQDSGKRVDLVSFGNTSKVLKQEVDNHHDGFLVPGLLPVEDAAAGRNRGTMISINEEKGYGFLALRTGLGVSDYRYDVFCHISDFKGSDDQAVSNEYFAGLKARNAVVEFDLTEGPGGKPKAANVREFHWQGKAFPKPVDANGKTRQ